jgi:hypothetical protein
MSSDGGVIQNFIRSLYSGRFYAVAPQLDLKIGFKNLFLLAAILGIVTATQWASSVSRGIAEWEARVEDGTMPAILLEKGQVSVRGGAQPYFRREAGGGALIVDTTGTYSGVPDSIPEGLFIGRDRAVYKTAPQVSRTYEFRNQSLGFWLDGSGLKRVRGAVLPAVFLVGAPIAFVYYFAVNTVLALALSWLGVILTRAFSPGSRFTYGQVLTVMLFVLTPVSILFRFLGLVVPEYSSRLLPFYPALAASLLLAALRASMMPPEPPQRL